MSSDPAPAAPVAKNGKAVSIWMSSAQHARLVDLHQRTGRSHSEIVCALVDDYHAGRIWSTALPAMERLALSPPKKAPKRAKKP